MGSVYSCGNGINSDGTEFKNSNIPVLDAEECNNDPDKCYSLIPNSPFGTTRRPLKFYKKTIVPKTEDHAITEIIVPANTPIHFEDSSTSNSKKKRVPKGIVSRQTCADKKLINGNAERQECSLGEEILKSCSLFDSKFEYNTGDTVVSLRHRTDWDLNIKYYEEYFCGYDEWSQTTYQPNVTRAPGIHVFSSRVAAEQYDFQ